MDVRYIYHSFIMLYMRFFESVKIIHHIKRDIQERAGGFGRLTDILSLLFLSLLISCTERIDFATDDEFTRLVVDGALTTDTMAHVIRLSTTAGFFSGEPVAVVTGAKMTLSYGSGIYQIRETSPGYYQTGSFISGSIGQTYTLKIRLASPVGGFSDYQAISRISEKVKLDSIRLIFHPDYSEEGMWEIRGYWQDPPEMNYYRFLVYRNGKRVTDTLNEWFVTDDRFFNGKYVKGGTIAFIDRQQDEAAFEKGDRITIEMGLIGRDYFDFISGLQTEMRGSFPLFSATPANARGNLSNGAIGFFAAYSVSRNNVIIR